VHLAAGLGQTELFRKNIIVISHMSKTVLVVECQGNLNWYDIFEGATFDGQSVKIEQAEWDDIT